MSPAGDDGRGDGDGDQPPDPERTGLRDNNEDENENRNGGNRNRSCPVGLPNDDAPTGEWAGRDGGESTAGLDRSEDAWITPEQDPPQPEVRAGDGDGDGGRGFPRQFVLDVVGSVVSVVLVGLLLFAISGVWPPLVAVESGSMYPHMKTGDLVFVMEEERFHGEGARAGTGVVTARAAGDYRKFQRPGDVIVYAPRGNDDRTPIIHRAMFWVAADENWYDKADAGFVGGADDCGELLHCPAPHAGFVTLGDNNGVYDQARTDLPPVKPAWVVGTAEIRIPALGWVRLRSGAGQPAGPRANATLDRPTGVP